MKVTVRVDFIVQRPPTPANTRTSFVTLAMPVDGTLAEIEHRAELLAHDIVRLTRKSDMIVGLKTVDVEV